MRTRNTRQAEKTVMKAEVAYMADAKKVANRVRKKKLLPSR